MDNWLFYVIALLIVAVAVYAVKKVAGCLLKTMVFLMMLVALSAGYYYFIMHP